LDAITGDSWPRSGDFAGRPEGWFSWWKATVIAGVAACAAFLFLPGIWLSLNSDHRTGTAQLSEVVLPDGTQVHLAPESAIGLDFDEKGRFVRLLKGDAFFEVERDESRPFRVFAAGVSVTVLGTAFEVDQFEGAVSVRVSHGRVKVEDQRTSQLLSESLGPGEALRVERDGSHARSAVLLDEIAQWRENRLIARDISIGEVIDALSHYHKGSVFVSESFAERRVTGLYNLDTPLETLEGIAASHGAEVERASPWFIWVKD
ncbi:MAG: FecR domain-containing protein, partial [Verrucomicrobiota bacterium]